MRAQPLWRIFEWIGIILYAALVFEFLRLWIAPSPNDIERILTLVMLVLFEFVLVHSGVFMAVMPRKMSLFIFIPFYGIFALAMNAAVPGNTILILYMAVVLVRMRYAFSNPTDEMKTKTLIFSGAAAFLYFILMFIFAFGGDFLPKFGLTHSFLQGNGFFNLANASGEFIEKPHIALSMGAVYFTLLSVLEIKVFGLLKNTPPKD